MFIRETLNINQQPMKYYRFGTYGDRLWDEKGFLDATGETVIKTEEKHYPMNIDVKSEDLPTEFTNLNKSINKTETIEPTITTTESKPEIDKSQDDDKLIMGMTKKQLMLGVGLGILVGIVAYYSYKKFNAKNITTNIV